MATKKITVGDLKEKLEMIPNDYVLYISEEGPLKKIAIDSVEDEDGPVVILES